MATGQDVRGRAFEKRAETDDRVELGTFTLHKNGNSIVATVPGPAREVNGVSVGDEVEIEYDSDAGELIIPLQD